MDEVENFKKEIEKIKNDFKNELSKINVSRLGPSMLENYLINIGGKQYYLKQLANVSFLGEGVLKVEPYTLEYLPMIEASLSKANLNFTVRKEKDHLHVRLSPLTEESKKNFLKIISEKKEKVKIESRKVRDEFINKIKRQKEEKKISEDMFFKSKKKIDEIIENFNKEIEEIYKNKEKEILM
jgi:ribosome recycling factor